MSNRTNPLQRKLRKALQLGDLGRAIEALTHLHQPTTVVPNAKAEAEILLYAKSPPADMHMWDGLRLVSKQLGHPIPLLTVVELLKHNQDAPKLRGWLDRHVHEFSQFGTMEISQAVYLCSESGIKPCARKTGRHLLDALIGFPTPADISLDLAHCAPDWVDPAEITDHHLVHAYLQVTGHAQWRGNRQQRYREQLAETLWQRIVKLPALPPYDQLIAHPTGAIRRREHKEPMAQLISALDQTENDRWRDRLQTLWSRICQETPPDRRLRLLKQWCGMGAYYSREILPLPSEASTAPYFPPTIFSLQELTKGWKPSPTELSDIHSFHNPTEAARLLMRADCRLPESIGVLAARFQADNPKYDHDKVAFSHEYLSTGHDLAPLLPHFPQHLRADLVALVQAHETLLKPASPIDAPMSCDLDLL